MKIKILLLLVSTAILVSCVKEQNPLMTERNKNVVSKETETRSMELCKMLSFSSEKEFMKVLHELGQLSSNEEKAAWVKEHYPDFVSIMDIYSCALSEAEELDNTQESFIAFKEKYNRLYFPMEGDDAGFYILIKDLDIAFLVNPDYNIIIGNKVCNMQDMHNYQDLYNLGRTYYNVGTPMLADQYSEFKFATNKANIGERYESGWKYNGIKDVTTGEPTEDGADRKLNLKIDRQLKEQTIPAGSDSFKIGQSFLHVEISFRKKTIFGWVNYSSKTKLTGKLTLSTGTYGINYDCNNSGSSSHDLWDPLPVRITQADGAFIATFDKIIGNLSIQYQGFEDIRSFNVSMNGAYCRIYSAGAIIPTL